MPAKKPPRKASRKRAAAKAPPRRGRAAGKKAPVREKPPTKKAAKSAPRFGRAGTAGKAEGDAPVLAYIAELPPGPRAIAEKVDAIIHDAVPGVRRAMKWSMPLYGLEGKGWFAAFSAHQRHCAVRFFQGASLQPVPPEGEGKEGRSVHYGAANDLDAAQLRAWVRQAAALPGWGR